MTFKLVSDLQLKAKTVFCRVDFNVPLDGTRITDDRRIQAALPTLRWMIDQGARVVCASHLGRPKGQRKQEFSLAPVAVRLAELLGQDVRFAADCVGAEAAALRDSLENGQVGLLENLRFHEGETKGAQDFAASLAKGYDAFVNDAFGAAHRAHASVSGVSGLIPVRAAGFLMAREIESLSKLIREPRRPYYAILGGAKVSDKIELVEKLIEKVDGLLIGGAMAYTFLAAQGHEIGSSRVESDKLDLARHLESLAASRKVAIHLPIDHLIGTSIDGKSVLGLSATPGVEIPAGGIGVDIGPQTIESFRARLAPETQTVLWNGPVGFFEAAGCDKGTRRLAEHLAGMSAFTVLGGGDTAAAARVFGLEDEFAHVSTGGGAALELLSGTTLPGVAALER